MIVSPNRKNISFGYNGFPPRIRDDDRLEVREVKYDLVIHAEVNAILNCGWLDSHPGSVLYVTGEPCIRCAVTICAKPEIAAVIVRERMSEDRIARWKSGNSLKVFEEAGLFYWNLSDGDVP